MSKRHYLSILFVISLFLAACQNQNDPLPQASAGATNTATGLASPTVATLDTPTATAEHAAPTITPTAAPTQPPTPSPTATPAPSDTPQPALTPTATATPARPQITAFDVEPAEARPGDVVTLAWEARGDRATICPTAQYLLFTADDCRQVPLSGTTSFTIPSEAAGFQYIDFMLQVETEEPAATSTAQVRVAFECQRTWFFSDEPQAGICPLEPLYSPAAAQRFERGTMIWLETPGRYYILDNAPLFEGSDRKRVKVINDPLAITRDTSSQYDPPPGLYAPQSGFGLVWRGDVEGSPGYVEQLGWAIEPEFAYQAILQCDDARPSGGRSWQTCYLQGPAGDVIVLHPLGGWLLQSEP